jgi:predicted phage terminase large subunit-like protein
MVQRVRSTDVLEAERDPPPLELPPGVRKLGPQDGPQTKFASCGADIAIYGGSAGSGKSFSLLLEPVRYCTMPKYAGYNCVTFRRSIPSIRNPGSIWDQSYLVYPEIGGSDKQSSLEWEWPGAGKIKFAHLEHESTVYDWHGSQITLLQFDELCEFSEKQFFYMLSRNRSECGVRPYLRATCNPDADSWVAKFIAWWIDDREYIGEKANPNYGFPRMDRSGKVRFFVRVGDDLVWADRAEELNHEKLGLPRFTPDGQEIPLKPISATFIAASIYDNKELLKNDPDYLAKLLILPTVERERLLKGNWKIRPAPGLYFNRNWVEIVKSLPPGLIFKRGWDLAATEKNDLNDPDATASCKIGKDIMEKIYYVVDSTNIMTTPFGVEAHMTAIAKGEGGDGPQTEQWIPQDPAQAGKHQVAHFGVMLDGVPVRHTPERGDKVVRFSAFSATAQAGRVKVLQGPWNNRWFSALESFPAPTAKDDDVDATSRAFNAFLDGTSGLVEYMQIEAEKLRREALAATNAQIPTLAAGGVRVYPPSTDINQLFDMKGRLLPLEADGTFIVTKVHAEFLVGHSRFRYANGDGSH